MTEMTITEAAQATGYSEAHLRRLARDGEIEARRVGERLWLVDAESVKAYVQRMNELGTRKFDPTGA